MPIKPIKLAWRLPETDLQLIISQLDNWCQSMIFVYYTMILLIQFTTYFWYILFGQFKCALIEITGMFAWLVFDGAITRCFDPWPRPFIHLTCLRDICETFEVVSETDVCECECINWRQGINNGHKRIEREHTFCVGVCVSRYFSVHDYVSAVNRQLNAFVRHQL